MTVNVRFVDWQAFNLIDQNHDEFIDKEDLRVVFNSLGEKIFFLSVLIVLRPKPDRGFVGGNGQRSARVDQLHNVSHTIWR